MLNPQTALAVKNYLSAPSHALLICGPAGAGKAYLAKLISAQLLKVSPQKVLSHPSVIHLTKPDDKQEIAIDEVRRLIRTLRLKAPGDADVRRVVLVEDANFLSLPAQNALLKILEEPDLQTVFLLTSPSETYVLPTTASRAQKLIVHPVSLAQSLKHYDARHSKASVESSWRLSGGQAGLLDALLENQSEHPLKKAVDLAKSWLGQSRYERLLFFDKLASNKIELAYFIEGLSKVLAALHHSYIAKGGSKPATALLHSRKLVDEAGSALDVNVNPKLVGLYLATHLKV